MYFCLSDNSCDLITCTRNEVCIINIQNIPMCRCPTLYWCRQAERKPLCSESGVTYKSRCHLKIDECNSGRRIRIKHRGSCKSAEGGKLTLGKGSKLKDRAERRKERRKERHAIKQRNQHPIRKLTDRQTNRQEQKQSRKKGKSKVDQSNQKQKGHLKNWEKKTGRRRFKRRCRNNCRIWNWDVKVHRCSHHFFFFFCG